MIHSESLIALVRMYPELWDFGNPNYPNKTFKKTIWKSIAEKLCVTVPEVKSHWTNLRDMFRRDIKKCLQQAKETEDLNVSLPRWRHFQSMLFLKEHITKDELINSIQFIDPNKLCSMIRIEDVCSTRIVNCSLNEDESEPATSHQAKINQSSSPKKRAIDSGEEQSQISNKRHHWDEESNGVADCDDIEDFNPACIKEMDEDYYFLMSILPSIRRVKQERKTSFKMKILQLILEEEEADST